MKPLFYPSFQEVSNNETYSSRFILLILLLFLSIVVVLGFVTIDLDHPFLLLDFQSRALYVDEGFYADAAQNFEKFGQWDMPLDSRHWAGAPFLAVVQTIVFKLFGVSLTAARLISISMSVISAIALYAISRTRFTPGVSLGLVISAVLTFNFIGFSRAGIADPTATAMSMLALLVFVRVQPKAIAIPLSLLFAYFAFFSKMYFLFAPITLVFLWAAELLVLPYFLNTQINWRTVFLYVGSIVMIALSYWLFRVIYQEEVANFLFINGNKKPVLDYKYLFESFDDANEKLRYNTKSPYFIALILASAAYFLVTRLWSAKLSKILVDAKQLGRAEWALGAFLCSGYFIVGTLHAHKAHYHYFTILPIAFLAISAISLIFRGHIKTWLIVIALGLHLIHQFSYYQKWFSRTNQTSLVNASKEMAAFIDAENDDKIVPIIGEFSAQLSLYSDTLMSLDAKWGSGHQMCKRVDYWRPKYHVNVVWPKSGKIHEREYIASCKIVNRYEEITRYTIFKPWQDQIVLSRLIYEQ